MKRAELSIGDRVRALATLAPADADTWTALVRMLQPRERPGAVARAASRAAHAPPSAPPMPLEEMLKPIDKRVDEVEPKFVEPLLSGDFTDQPPRVTRLKRRAFTGERAIAADGGIRFDRPAGVRPTPRAIIDPDKARAVLAPLAAAPGPSRRLDIEALVARVARGKPLEHLPRRSVWTVRRGAQLLIDCGAALLPLARDTTEVQERLRSIVGEERLQVAYFAGCPLRGVGPAERDGWKTWSPPLPGVPVIIVSDVGTLGPLGNTDWASMQEWMRFARCARAAATPLVALVPFPAARIAGPLTRLMSIVPWTEQLDAAHVRRILRDGRSARVG